MALKFVDVYSGSADNLVTDPNAQGTIIKVSQGTYYVNPKYQHQWDLANGRLRGLYHYAGGGDPVAEADYFLQYVGDKVGQAVLALDWESYQNSAWKDTTWCRRFVDRVHERTGVWPLIYTSESALYQAANCANNCGLWVAKYPFNWRSWVVPDMSVNTNPWDTYTLWQFAGEDEDRSVANVDEDGWQKIANPTGGEIQYTKPAETQAPAPQPVNSWVDDLGVRWFSEDGTFTLDTAINLRWGATTQSSVIAQLPAGSSVNYDAFCYSGGYVWIRQPRGNGQYGYLATGNAVNGKRTDYWGKFE